MTGRISEYIQGILAVLSIGTLAGIALIDSIRNQPFTDPTTLSAIAGAIIGFYFARIGSKQTAETIQQAKTDVSSNDTPHS